MVKATVSNDEKATVSNDEKATDKGKILSVFNDVTELDMFTLVG